MGQLPLYILNPEPYQEQTGTLCLNLTLNHKPCQGQTRAWTACRQAKQAGPSTRSDCTTKTEAW